MNLVVVRKSGARGLLLNELFGVTSSLRVFVEGPDFRHLPRHLLLDAAGPVEVSGPAISQELRDRDLGSLDLEKLAAAVSDGLNVLLRRKMDATVSKFSYMLREGSGLRVALTQDLNARVFDAVSGTDITPGFDSASERVAMYFALVSALRRHLYPGWDMPFVATSVAGQTEELMGRALFDFISTMSGQTIVIERPDFYKEMSLSPDFELSLGQVPGTLELTACAP